MHYLLPRNHWKSHNLTQISDGALDTIIQHASELPSAHCEVFLGLLAGVANDVSSGATAYCARDAKFVVNAHGRWQGAEQDDECIGWSRAFFKAATPYASSGAYVNFVTADESERVTAGLRPKNMPG